MDQDAQINEQNKDVINIRLANMRKKQKINAKVKDLMMMINFSRLIKPAEYVA